MLDGSAAWGPLQVAPTACQTALASEHQRDRPMPEPGISSASLMKGVEKLIERLDSKLAAYLEEVGVGESVAQLREEFCATLVSDGAIASEVYLDLNQERISGDTTPQLFVNMFFAAIEEARDLAASEPVQAFTWLMEAGNVVGYGSGMENAAYLARSLKDAKSKAAKQSSRSSKADALKADVLDFIAKRQPPEGWNRAQAIQHYIELPFEQTSPLVQEQGFDEYWVGMDAKLRRWLLLPDFSKAFDSLLRG